MAFLAKLLDKYYRKHSKHYAGQEPGAYGYAAIVVSDAYMADRYGRATLIDEHQLTMDSQTIGALTKVNRTCSIVASARLSAFLDQSPIEASLAKAFDFARKRFFNPHIGTIPFFLSSILNKLAKHTKGLEGYRAHASCVWNFEQIKGILDKNLPLIMNIMQGYYANHSISVCGYKCYKTEGKVINLLAVYDGWHEGVRYLDLSAFEKDFRAGAIASFNWLA